jgi:hypothetical protein
MNLQEELASLICAHHPVLTIISNKETRVQDAAIKSVNKRRKKSPGRR